MHIAEVLFECEKAGDAEAALEAIDNFLGVLRASGQVLGREFPMVEAAQGYRVFLMLPREDSMDRRYDSEYVTKGYAWLAKVGLRTAVAVLGEAPDSAEPCTCVDRDWLILYTNYAALESCLRCGACFGPLPLYEVPPDRDMMGELHDKILGWQSDCQACDTLQMGCATGERFGLREMSHHESSLSKRGRELCRRIEAGAGTPTYYYLHRYRGKRGEDEYDRPCPACGSEWRLSEPLHDLFDFKCESCRLLSNIALSK